MIDALWSRVHRAYAILRQGDIEHARAQFKICVEGFYNGDSEIGLVYAIEGLASLNVNQEPPERATRLFAWADATREKINDFRPPVERASVEGDLEVVHSRMNDAAFAKAYAEGKIMTVEKSITLALGELDH